MKNIRAILLAGGDSTRLWPLENKMFLKFLGKPLFIYCIEQLIRHGIKDIVIITASWNKEQFKKNLPRHEGVDISVIEQKDPRGMAGAALSAADHLKNTPVLIINPSDIVEDKLFDRFDQLLTSNPKAVLAGKVHESYFPGGYLVVQDGLLKKIVEKPDPQNRPSNIVRFVFDYFENGSDLLEKLSSISSETDDVYEQAIAQLIEQGFPISYLPYDGFWGYLKYPWHVLMLAKYFLSTVSDHRGDDVSIHKTAIIEGPVYFEPGVKVMEYAKIAGPAYIGKNTVIGSLCMVRESMIGEGCVVGYTTDIARSYIGDHCWFHTDYVGDSVLAENISIGSGTVTANFRLDESEIHSHIQEKKVSSESKKLGALIGPYVRIGVNSSILPGKKIGKNSFISAGVIVDKDIPDNSFCIHESSNFKVIPNTAKVGNNADRFVDPALKK